MGATEEPAISKPVIPGTNRSGKKRLGQLAVFESSEEPTEEQDLPGNQLVRTADPLESELPVQTVLSASICDEIENSQIAGSSNSLQQFQEIQSDQGRDAAELELEREYSSEDCSESLISAFITSVREGVEMSGGAKDPEKDKDPDKDKDPGKENGGEPDKEKGGEPEVQFIEDSPTTFNKNKLPKTVKSNQCGSVVASAHTLRTKILKNRKNMDRVINQIRAVQEQTDLDEDDRENFLDDLYAKVHGENKEMEDNLKEHENRTYQIRTMGGYIEKGNLDCNQPMAVKTRSEATLALAEADKHELELDEATTKWTTNNLRFLAVRRRKKSETRSVARQTDVRNPDRLFLGTFEKTLVPKEELRAARNL